MSHASSDGVFALVMVVVAAFRDRASLGVRSAFRIRRLSRVAASQHVWSDPLLEFFHVQEYFRFHCFFICHRSSGSGEMSWPAQ